MKTIAELNEKWYWRFIKVGFIFLGIIGFLFVSIGTFEYINTKTYHPKVVQGLQDLQKKAEEKFQLIQKMFPKNTYSPDEVVEIFRKENIVDEQKMIFIHLILALGKRIDNVSICQDYNCGTSSGDIDAVFSYCSYFTSLEDEESCEDYELVYVHNDVLVHLQSILNGRVMNIINKINNNIYISIEEKNFLNGIHSDNTFDVGERDYIPPIRYLYSVIIWIVGIILWLGILYLIRGTTYYTILGKFNPDKS